MKSNIILAFFGAMLSAMLIGCTHDIDMDIESTEGILCVNAILKSGVESNTIFVTKTTKDSYKTYGMMIVVDDAVIRVTVNGTEKEVVSATSEDSNPSEGVYRIHTVLSPEDIVSIEVVSGNQRISYEGQVPKGVENLAIEDTRFMLYHKFRRGDQYGQAHVVSVNVSFDDNGEFNYYTLALGNEDSIVCKVMDDYMHSYYNMDWGEISYLNWSEEGTTEKTWKHSKSNAFVYDINGQAPLADEEVVSQSDNDMVLMNTYNIYKTFNNSRFRGGKCQMTVLDEFRRPITYLTRSDMPAEIAPSYFYDQLVTVTSISEDFYYYIKVLNNKRNYDDEDMSDISGAFQIPSNVEGGTGNIFLTTETTARRNVLNGWRPEPIIWDEYVIDEDPWHLNGY